MEWVTRPQWLFYELRRIGYIGMVAPVLVVSLFVGVAAAASLSGTEQNQIARLLTASMELGLSLIAGLIAAHIVASEPAPDLHLTLRTHYRTTLLRRLTLFVAWTAALAFSWSVVLSTLGLWAVPGPFLAGQLAWIAPLMWFVSAGMLFALLLHSRAAASVMLGLLWVFENTPVGIAGFLNSDWLRPFFLFATTHAPGADFWLSNRLTVIILSIVLLLVSLVLLGRESSSVGGEE